MEYTEVYPVEYYKTNLSIHFLWGCLAGCSAVVLLELTAVKLPLQRRHDEHYGVSNHQHIDCLLSGLFRRRSKKTPKLRVNDVCEGYPLPTASPHKRPIRRKIFMFDDAIMTLSEGFGPLIPYRDKIQQSTDCVHFPWDIHFITRFKHTRLYLAEFAIFRDNILAPVSMFGFRLFVNTNNTILLICNESYRHVGRPPLRWLSKPTEIQPWTMKQSP